MILLRGARLALAIAVLTAVGYQLVQAESAFKVVNLFSFFTILSNLLGALVLLIMVVRGSQPVSARFAWWRNAAFLYLLTTGVVFAVLLADVSVGLTEPWVNTILHTVMPTLFVLDWIIDGPRHRITLAGAAEWTLFPVGYLVYSLIRGELTDPAWYPYPFINVTLHGYAGVALSAVGLLVFFLVLSALTWKLTNWRVGQREPVSA